MIPGSNPGVASNFENNYIKAVSYTHLKGAAGLTLAPENLEKFKEAINKSCSCLNMQECKSSDELLGDIMPSEIDFELLEILEFYEPYGQKNPRPVFKIENAVVKNERLIGSCCLLYTSRCV